MWIARTTMTRLLRLATAATIRQEQRVHNMMMMMPRVTKSAMRIRRRVRVKRSCPRPHPHRHRHCQLSPSRRDLASTRSPTTTKATTTSREQSITFFFFYCFDVSVWVCECVWFSSIIAFRFRVVACVSFLPVVKWSFIRTQKMCVCVCVCVFL